MDWFWVLAVAVFGFGSAPDLPGPVDPDDPVVSSELVAHWDQATYDGLPRDVEAQVIDSDAERDAFLARLPFRDAAVEQVDLDSMVLVVGGYHSCQQSSYVEHTPTGPTFGVTETPEGLACAWSPYTIDVHAVAR